MVDWSLARQVARFAAGSAPAAGKGEALPAIVARVEPEIAGYTKLRPVAPVPETELLSRAEWAELNVGTLGELLDPVGDRLGERLSRAGALAGPLRAASGATLAAEAGLVIGYVSHRILGQYELSLLQPETPARLLFVTPNIEAAVHDLGVDEDSFLGWIALHELTHVFQFSGVPWLQEHLAGLLRSYLETVEVQVKHGAAGGLPSLPDPARLVEGFRDGGLAALVQTREQRTIIGRVQATMAVIEGYAEHVMDAVGAQTLPAYDGLRDAMTERRSSRSAPERVLQRLLGLDVKLRQYELGKSFCDEVVGWSGIEGLNRVWSQPEALPSMVELRRPERWLARVRDAAPAAATA